MSVDMATSDPEDATRSRGTLLMKVPGRARPQKQALKEFNEAVTELRRRYEPAFWPLVVPEARDMFRWRVLLDCGCAQEVYTHGDDRFPDDRSYLDHMTDAQLPPGEFWCAATHASAPNPYREIVEWCDRKIIDFPADPEEPEYAMDPETWALIRHDGPHSSAFWRVKLECGHYGQVCTEIAWKPEDGPKLASRKRITEMRADFEESWSTDGDGAWPAEGPEREHLRKMLDLRWPRPAPDQDCYTCAHISRIVGYQRIGWLVRRTPPVPAPAPRIDRDKIAARLAAAEAEVERLKHQLSSVEN
ncbi:hypothetical protein ET475_08555 [Microbacterium protaetiae]|uniref:Uncharacterized protein n=1 Tax=Microbacterium protaetiae TaxID=2509458 RepID=A0A4P6ECS5_9MICO|nr:hypothetical protein [Microbacterium protaetiae]QAY60035.1 hypothetical protein ET475_08555 [Microbacterium protaetiae]